MKECPDLLDLNGTRAIDMQHIRRMARLLQLRKEEKLSDCKWDELMSYSTGRDTKTARSTFVEYITAAVLIPFLKYKQGQEDIIDFLCSVSYCSTSNKCC